MDQTIIDLGDLPDVTGEEAVLLGKQGNKELSVIELSKRWETNTYSVYTDINARVPRRPRRSPAGTSTAGHAPA